MGTGKTTFAANAVIRIVAAFCCFFYWSVAAAQHPELQQLLDRNDYFALRDRLVVTNNLDPASRLYYTAFTDNGFNRNELAIRRADSFLAIAKNTWPPQQVLRIEEMLMDSYVKTYKYATAADISHAIMNKYQEQDRAGILNAQKIWEALRNVPPQKKLHRRYPAMRLRISALPATIVRKINLRQYTAARNKQKVKIVS